MTIYVDSNAFHFAGDIIITCVYYFMVYRNLYLYVFTIFWYIGLASYGLLYYQDYVPNIALTTVNDFLLRILRHYLHFSCSFHVVMLTNHGLQKRI